MEITIKKYYSCPICGRSFTEKEKVDECERSHVKVAPDTAIEMKFRSGAWRLYPETISVLMEDGAVVDYSFSGAKKVRE